MMNSYLFLILGFLASVSGWNADAGIVTGYQVHSTLTASSTMGDQYDVNNIVDGDTDTKWWSAAVKGPSCQNVTIDLKAVKEIGYIYIRTWDSSTKETKISVSTDNKKWTLILTHPTSSFQGLSYPLDQTYQGRYVFISQCADSDIWFHGNVYELRLFDQYGSYGPPGVPDDYVNPYTMKELLGVNGIWEWNGVSPQDFSSLFSNARNYESLSWDIGSPGDTPNFDHPSASWLNWTDEYSKWRKTVNGVPGFNEIMVTLNYGNSGKFAADQWKNPWEDAYKYGYTFGKYFGPKGNKLINYAEAGNEPWDFDADFLQKLIAGFCSGFKDGGMESMTCALSANSVTSSSYIGTRVTEEMAANISIINMHSYSHYQGSNKVLATYPEDPKSGMHSIRNMIRWRNANMPGKKVFLTEWGWDGESTWDTPACLSGPYHNVCVSNEAKCLYGIRGALTIAREGIEKMIWYFYENTAGDAPLYSRSGLRSTTGKKETVFTAFQQFLQVLGDLQFMGAVSETNSAYVYILGTSDGSKQTQMVAWRPVAAEDSKVVPTTIEIDGWVIAGSESTVISAFDVKTVSTSSKVSTDGSQWTFQLDKNLLVIPVDSGSPSSQGSSPVVVSLFLLFGLTLCSVTF